MKQLILIFFVYTFNFSGEAEETFKQINYDGELIFRNIISEGHPQDWDSGNVVIIGIISENKINETKLERFYDLAQNNYLHTKNLFKSRYEYYFFLGEDMTINSVEIEGIGKPGTTKNNINAVNLIKITRFTIYKDKPITANLYVWEDK